MFELCYKTDDPEALKMLVAMLDNQTILEGLKRDLLDMSFGNMISG